MVSSYSIYRDVIVQPFYFDCIRYFGSEYNPKFYTISSVKLSKIHKIFHQIHKNSVSFLK